MTNEGFPIPNYGGVKFLGTFYVILGIVLCVAGVAAAACSLLAGTVGWSPTTKPVTVDGVLISGTIGAIGGGALFLGGMLQIGIGQLFYCFRDLARNSFNLQRLP